MKLSCLKCQGIIWQKYKYWCGCDSACCIIMFDQEGKIKDYDYDQTINGQTYFVKGYQNNKTTAVYKPDPRYSADKPIIVVDQVPINNQEEFENLLPRLLKMKAFV